MELTNKKKLSAAALAGAVATATLVAGSMAFFTDRAEVDATATSAKTTIDLAASWSDELVLPGEKIDLPSTITSTGNRAIDVRETFVLTSSVAFSNDTVAEFEIYKANDVEVQPNGSYAPKSGANPVTTGADRVLSSDGLILTYKLPEFIMTGGEDAPEGTVGTEVTKDYVALFKADADNTYQNAKVTIDYVVEAKQHNGTNTSDWNVLATNSIENVNGSYVAPAQ